MTIKQKQGLRKGILIAVMCLIALIYIYPVFLMFMNSFCAFLSSA